MTGPTRPRQSLSINAILGIAALCATASVLAVPRASVGPADVVASTPAPDQAQIHRDLTANLKVISREVGTLLTVVEVVANPATS